MPLCRTPYILTKCIRVSKFQPMTGTTTPAALLQNAKCCCKNCHEMQKKTQITSLPFLGSFIGFLSRNGYATKLSLPLTGQFMITPPSTSLIFSKNTTLLAFSDQHLDLSLMFPGPGIPRQSGTASEPSDMSLPPSGMSSPRASRRRTPFSFSDLR